MVGTGTAAAATINTAVALCMVAVPSTGDKVYSAATTACTTPDTTTNTYCCCSLDDCNSTTFAARCTAANKVNKPVWKCNIGSTAVSQNTNKKLCEVKAVTTTYTYAAVDTCTTDTATDIYCCCGSNDCNDAAWAKRCVKGAKPLASCYVGADAAAIKTYGSTKKLCQSANDGKVKTYSAVDACAANTSTTYNCCCDSKDDCNDAAAGTACVKGSSSSDSSFGLNSVFGVFSMTIAMIMLLIWWKVIKSLHTINTYNVLYIFYL